jgi:response regulator RpfG family c-di-GMP phosphodiesterase
MRILVIGPDPELVDLVEQAALAAAFGPFEIEALPTVPQDGERPSWDALVFEHAPPQVDSLAVLQRCRAARDDGAPIVAVAGAEQGGIKTAALEAGCDDVLVRPFSSVEFERRVRNVLRQAAYRTSLQQNERWIRAQVASVRRELEALQEEIILKLCRAGGYRDHETGAHIVRMARYCELIADELGFPAETCRFIYSAAQMHDIGKIGIPDAILQKPARLTPEERRVMEEHTLIGEAILQGSTSPLIQAAEMIAGTHHERWDGAGYPRGLKGEAIPIAGRIAAVADVFDALTSDRQYKRGWPLDEAREELLRNRGAYFDPACVDALLRRWDEVAAIASSAVHEALADELQRLRAGAIRVADVSESSHSKVPRSPPATGMNSTIGVS